MRPAPPAIARRRGRPAGWCAAGAAQAFRARRSADGRRAAPGGPTRPHRPVPADGRRRGRARRLNGGRPPRRLSHPAPRGEAGSLRTAPKSRPHTWAATPNASHDMLILWSPLTGPLPPTERTSAPARLKVRNGSGPVRPLYDRIGWITAGPLLSRRGDGRLVTLAPRQGDQSYGHQASNLRRRIISKALRTRASALPYPASPATPTNGAVTGPPPSVALASA